MIKTSFFDYLKPAFVFRKTYMCGSIHNIWGKIVQINRGISGTNWSAPAVFSKNVKMYLNWLQELVGMREIIVVIMHLKIIEYNYLGRFTKIAFWEFTFCSVISSNCIVNCEIVIKSFRYLLIRRVVFGDYFAIDIPSCSSDQFYFSKLLRRCTKSNKIQHTLWSK